MSDPFASLPRRDYQLLLADPPWAFRTHSGKNRTPTQKRFNEAEDHYPTMPIDDMKALPVSTIADKDALLAMWIVGSHCDVALDLGRAWGFRFVTDLFYWTKQRLMQANQVDLFTGDIAEPRISMGYHTRKQLEPCWLFARGKGLPVLNHDVRQLIVAPIAEHSRKPAEQYDRLARLYGTPDDTPCVELFSRTPRAGWHAWGNETGKFAEVTP